MNDEELIKETMMLDYSQLVMNNVYLHKENKELKQKIEYYENFEINKTIDKIRVENNKRFKEQQEELESLKQINEDHQRINGELRVENERLNKGLTELDNMFYETFRISQNGYYSISEWELKDFTDKLQELKGVDKSDR